MEQVSRAPQGGREGFQSRTVTQVLLPRDRKGGRVSPSGLQSQGCPQPIWRWETGAGSEECWRGFWKNRVPSLYSPALILQGDSLLGPRGQRALQS